MCALFLCVSFFFKQKTAYDITYGDWSFRRVLFRSISKPVAPARQNGTGQQSPVGQQPKSGKPIKPDDLKKIDGIGPGVAATLQKLGTRTFIQIARWKPEDIEKIAKKLATDPERIKRENWVAGAKKQHYEKYKERL